MSVYVSVSVWSKAVVQLHHENHAYGMRKATLKRK